MQAVGGVRWGPALTGHGRRHGIEDDARAVAEGHNQVRCCWVATRERETHFETAEAALRVCLRGEDYDDRSVEDAVEQALRELVAVVNCAGVEKRQVAEFRRQGLGVGETRLARIGDENGAPHKTEAISLVRILGRVLRSGARRPGCSERPAFPKLPTLAKFGFQLSQEHSGRGVS